MNSQHSSTGSTPRRVLLSAGSAFGLIFGLGFALFTWGYDGLVLARVSSYLAWSKLLIGLPIAAGLGVLVGWMAARASSAGTSVVLWVVACTVLGLVSAHGMLAWTDLAVWLVDPRFRGWPVFLFGQPDVVRTILLVLAEAVLGAGVGIVEKLAIEWAWDRATPAGRLSWRSWGVIMIALPLALLVATSVNTLILGPLRTPQVAVGEAARLATINTQEGAVAPSNAVSPFRDRLGDRYTVHFVGFGEDAETWFSGRSDIVTQAGLVVRCFVFGDNVVHCFDLSSQLAVWMDQLVTAGLSGEPGWEADQVHSLSVEESTLAWLADHRDQLGGSYRVQRLGQAGGWILMGARFESRFELVCLFRGAAPVRVDRCWEARPNSSWYW